MNRKYGGIPSGKPRTKIQAMAKLERMRRSRMERYSNIIVGSFDRNRHIISAEDAKSSYIMVCKANGIEPNLERLGKLENEIRYAQGEQVRAGNKINIINRQITKLNEYEFKCSAFHQGVEYLKSLILGRSEIDALVE